jgi:outer membrane protein TolC
MYDLMSRRALKVARAAEGQLLPQIIAAGAVMNSGNEFFPSGNEEVVFSMIARWTIFDSGETAAKTKQAKAQARELIHLIDDMKNTIKMEVTQAELNLKSSHSRLQVAERQVAESEEDYRIAVRRYQEQVGTNLDMLDARLALTNSRTEEVEALYDIYIAEADLLYSLGK